MNFNEKITAIEEARKLHPEFNTEFQEYLGLGNSFNGAYHYFTLEDIKKYEPKPVKTATTIEKTVEPTPKSASKTTVIKTATK
jgi:hypothetical protein